MSLNVFAHIDAKGLTCDHFDPFTRFTQNETISYSVDTISVNRTITRSQTPEISGTTPSVLSNGDEKMHHNGEE
jgi:hypothetical protein